MPAVVHNDIKIVDNVGLLFITSASLKLDQTRSDTDIKKYHFDESKTVKIIFDAKWENHMYAYTWYWDNMYKKVYTYTAGNKQYLARMIAQWEVGHAGFDRVIILNDIWDYRRSNLHFKVKTSVTLDTQPLRDNDALTQLEIERRKNAAQ